MSTEAAEIYQRIAKLAVAKNLTISTVASSAGISPSRFSEWKNKQGNPSVKQLVDIARVLGVDIRALLEENFKEGNATTLTDDERSILEVYRDLGLSRREAVRGLAWIAGKAAELRRDLFYPKKFLRLYEAKNKKTFAYIESFSEDIEEVRSKVNAIFHSELGVEFVEPGTEEHLDAVHWNYESRKMKIPSEIRELRLGLLYAFNADSEEGTRGEIPESLAMEKLLRGILSRDAAGREAALEGQAEATPEDRAMEKLLDLHRDDSPDRRRARRKPKK